MSKAEKFIEEHTRDCSNIMEGYYPNGKQAYYPWIPRRQARRAVEIAKEEIYEWLRVNLCNYFDAPRCMFDMCLEDFKQAMKDET